MEGLIQNECFRLCLVRYLNPVNKNPAIIGNIDIEFAKQLNFKSMKFPFQKKKLMQKLESKIKSTLA